MRRLNILLIGIALALSYALAGVNKTLIKAQEMLINARTLDEYKKAKMKFESAYTYPGYVAAEHDEAIERGIKECEAKIATLSAKITVNGSSTPAVEFAAPGGSLTLDVRSTKGGRLKTKSSADWLSVKTVGADSITISCEPNEGEQARSATVTVSSGGARVKVTVTQEAVVLAISDITLTNTDSNGTEIGQLLMAETALYLQPQFKISGLITPADMKVCTRLYGPDRQLIASGTSPEGYTDGKVVPLRPGDNVVKFKGRGNDIPGYWPKGNYTLEVWVNDKKEASKTFRVISKGLTIWKVEFASSDKKGRLASAYGSPIYEEDAKCVRPRVIYCGVEEEKAHTLYAKVYRADGTLDRNKKSPAGFSYAETVTLRPGTNVCELPAWGKGKSGAYPEGAYLYELWDDDKILYSTNIYVASKRNPLSIDAVEYASVDSVGTALAEYGADLSSSDLHYLQSRIQYSGLKKAVTKTLSVKIYRPDGSMMRTPNSPQECTYQHTARLMPGEHLCELAPYDCAFDPGTYKIEYWADGMLLRAVTLDVN